MRKALVPLSVRKLREMAAKVKEWEDRDLAETGANSRPLYFVDLEELAQMFDGTHAFFVASVKPKGGWPRTASNTIRDFEIAEFMHDRRREPGYTHEDAKKAACEKFRIGEKAIERADTRFRKIMESDTDRETLLFFEVMSASRLATKTKP